MDDKTDVKPGATKASAQPPRVPNAGGGGAEGGQGKRFRRRRSFRGAMPDGGKSLEVLSREQYVPAHRLLEWRDRVLIAAESALKERERDARDDEIARLKAKVGEITMANELLCEKIDRLEAGRPLVGRRSRT